MAVVGAPVEPAVVIAGPMKMAAGADFWVGETIQKDDGPINSHAPLPNPVVKSVAPVYSGNVSVLPARDLASEEMRNDLLALVDEEFDGQAYLEQARKIAQSLPHSLVGGIDIYVDEDDGRGCFNWHVDGRSALLIIDGSDSAFYTVARRRKPGQAPVQSSGRFELSGNLPQWLTGVLVGA